MKTVSRAGAATAALLLALLAGCQTGRIPARGSDSRSLLLIPVVRIKRVSETPYVYYCLSIMDRDPKVGLLKERVIVYPERDYIIVSHLPPGSYRIDQVQSQYRERGSSWKRTLNIGFTLRAGYLSVLPRILRIELYEEQGTTYQRFSTLALSEEDRARILGQIEAVANLRGWQISFE